MGKDDVSYRPFVLKAGKQGNSYYPYYTVKAWVTIPPTVISIILPASVVVWIPEVPRKKENGHLVPQRQSLVPAPAAQPRYCIVSVRHF